MCWRAYIRETAADAGTERQVISSGSSGLSGTLGRRDWRECGGIMLGRYPRQDLRRLAVRQLEQLALK